MARFIGRAALALVVVAACAWAAAAQSGYEAGVGQRDISPSQQQMDSGEVYLGGYGLWKERGEPTGIHDPVWARAFVVVANGTALANAVLDVPGIANGALAEIAQTVEALTGGAINRNAVLVSSTHTHAGPDLQGLWGGVSPAYRQQVVNWTVDAIVEAYATRRPARLLLSVGAQQANNRRGWGYTDEDVTVLDLWDEQLNTRIGTVVNYAAHPVTLDSDNLLVSSDFCHYLRVYAEEALGAPVLYFNGIQGDVNARGNGSSFDKADDFGRQVADAVLASLTAQEELTGPADVYYNTQFYNHPVTNLAFLAAFRVGMLPDYDINDDNTFDLQVTYFRLGSFVQGVTSPGESLTRNGLPVKEAMVAKYRMFMGLSTNSIGYLVPTDEWESGRNGGYEESVSIDQNFGDVTRDLLISMVQADNDNVAR